MVQSDSRGEKTIFKNTQPQCSHVQEKDTNQSVFTSEKNVRTSVWFLGAVKKSFLCLPPSVWSHHLLLSAALLFVIFVSHKSLKIEVVNDQPTHFLLNTPPSHPLLKTKMLSSLALTSILFRTYPVIIEAEKKELPLSLFRSFNFDGPQIYGVGFLCLGVLATPPC